MKKVEKIDFEEFLAFFPEVDLPVTLTEESSLDFSNLNTPFTGESIFSYILPVEKEHDELTEYVPCFRMKDTNNFHAIIYWKASLLNYEYKLLTFNLLGEFIDGKVIAGTLTNGETIIRTVATIDEDWIIHTVIGEQAVRENKINTASKNYSLEILASGEIIFSLNEQKNE